MLCHSLSTQLIIISSSYFYYKKRLLRYLSPEQKKGGARGRWVGGWHKGEKVMHHDFPISGGKQSNKFSDIGMNEL